LLSFDLLLVQNGRGGAPFEFVSQFKPLGGQILVEELRKGTLALLCQLLAFSRFGATLSCCSRHGRRPLFLAIVNKQLGLYVPSPVWEIEPLAG